MAGGPTYLDERPGAPATDDVNGHGRDRAAEPSYYEIALTSRQVLIGFVILLASVVVAFFSGVWVGKSGTPLAVREAAAVVTGEAGPTGAPAASDPAGDRSGAGKDADKRAARRAARAAAANKPAATAEGPIEELKFFSEDAKKEPAAPSSAGASEPPSTVAAVANPPAVVASPSPPPAAVPVASQEPAASRPAPPTTAATTPIATPAAKAGKTSKVDSAPPSAPSTEVAAGAAMVQVFSSNDEVQARKVLGQLQQGGYRAFISPVTNPSGTVMHRVRVGPFASDGEARKVAEQIKQRLRLDTWITR